MFLPLPMMSMQMGPPTPYVKSRQWVILSLLILQTVACAMRMVLLLDIIGGFIMAIAMGIGWYAYKDGINITLICYWGMMSLINGAFDLVKLIDHWVKIDVPLFSREMPLRYNFMSATLLAQPMVTLPAALLAWYMYKSFTESEYSDGTGIYQYGRPTERDDPNERAGLLGGRRGRAAGSNASSGFQAFAGNGQRLGIG